jgi:hypothetical protein
VSDRRRQFTLGGLMLTVAAAGFVFGCLAWLLPSLGGGFHVHDTLIMIGPYVFPSDSAAFRAILLLVLALLIGLLVGMLAVIVCAVKAIRKRIMR